MLRGHRPARLHSITTGSRTDEVIHRRSDEVGLDLGDLYRLWVEHQKDIAEESRSLLPLTAVHYLDLSS